MEKGYTIHVLDHGYVRYIDHLGTDQRIVEAARVSYRSGSKGDADDKRLLNYLFKNKHTSPFEMVKVTLNIKLPIFVMRQYVRHRMQNLNEVSARYTVMPNEFYIPEKWRKQDTKNKQGSVEDGDWNPIMPGIHKVLECSDPNTPQHVGKGLTYVGLEHNNNASQELHHFCMKAYHLYEQMLAAGIAKEMARMVLPVNLYTEIYTAWDLKNLFHFLALRDDSHAQAEIQEYGKAIKSIVRELFPWSMEAYETAQKEQQDFKGWQDMVRINQLVRPSEVNA